MPPAARVLAIACVLLSENMVEYIRTSSTQSNACMHLLSSAALDQILF
jgi:hypothetical protein